MIKENFPIHMWKLCHLTTKVQLHLHEALLHFVPSYAVLLVGHFCYTVLGRKMKFALRLVMPITFAYLFLRILNTGLGRQENTVKAFTVSSVLMG